jgi:hypothetical protein
MSGEPLPELLDAKHLIAELGVTRAAAEAIMRRLPVVQFDGMRKVYVRGDDVANLVAKQRLQRPKWRDDVKGPDTSRVRGTLGEPICGEGLSGPVLLFRIGPVGSFLNALTDAPRGPRVAILG